MKLLLLNVIAASIACSSLGFKTNDTREIKKEETAIPRVAGPRYLNVEKNVEEYNDFSTVSNLGDLLNTDGSGNDYSLTSIDPSVLEEAKINEKWKDHVITGPIFDQDPGTGGSGGTSTSVAIEPYNEDSITDFINDYSFSATSLEKQGIINAYVNIHDTRYHYQEIDRDWYKFQIEEKHHFTFNFSAPNSSYYFELYRFTNNSACDEYTHNNHFLMYTTKYGNAWNYNCVLETGTYFILVSVTNKQSVIWNQLYNVTYTSDNIFENNYVVLTDDLLSQNSVVVWENENIPARINGWNQQPTDLYRWVSEDHLICEYEEQTGYIQTYNGYLDPVYCQNKDWTAWNTFNLPADESFNLDSIVYLSGKKTIKDFREMVNKLRYQLSQEAYDKKIESLRIEAEAKNWDAALGLIEVAITVFVGIYAGPYAAAVASAWDTFTTYVSYYETAVAVMEALSFSTDPGYYITGYDLGDNLRHLYDDCGTLLASNNPNSVLRIPVYSHLYNNHTSELEEVRYVRTMFPKSPRLFDDDYFFATKGSKVYREQTMPISSLDDGRVFKGNIKTYKDLKDFWEKTNPISEWSDPETDSDCLLNYSINRREDGKYYLDVTNTSNMGHLVTCSTTDATDTQGNSFNLKADSYVSELVSRGSPYRLCLKDRKYVYVRENWKGYVKKITFSNYQTSISNSINFGMEFMKLAIVKKDGTKWTIRIRNLYTQNLTITYNSKMCFSGDANNWTGLKHIAQTYIYYNGYKDVEIQENGWATSIAISYIRDGIRYISYAYALNKDSKTLSYHTNVKYVGQ